MTREKNHSEQEVDNVFKAVSPMASEPDNAFLQQLREQSAEAFVASSVTQAAPARWRIIMHSRSMRFATAAAVILVVILGISLFQGTESSAYAEVVQMLQQARSLVYTMVTEVNDGTGKKIETKWMYKDPDYLRTETEGGHVTILDGTVGKQLSYFPEGQQYIDGEMNLSNDDAESPFATVESLRALPAEADEVLEEKVIEIHTVQGFRVTTGDATTTVWIDVETRELVQAEMTYASAPGMNMVMKDFQFDADLDDSLFALVPPEGYTKNFTAEEGSGGTEAQFVEYLRYWSTELTKDKTFPPVVLGPQMSKVMVDMAMEQKFHNDKLDRMGKSDTYQALLWLAKLPKDSNWRYLGENVSYGDPDKPIFWYRPSGQSNYRVIYADVSVREVLPEDLPR